MPSEKYVVTKESREDVGVGGKCDTVGEDGCDKLCFGLDPW